MVRVIDDIAKVHDFQQKSGVGWVDDMALVGSGLVYGSLYIYFMVVDVRSLLPVILTARESSHDHIRLVCRPHCEDSNFSVECFHAVSGSGWSSDETTSKWSLSHTSEWEKVAILPSVSCPSSRSSAFI